MTTFIPFRSLMHPFKALITLALLATAHQVSAQRLSPPAPMTDELCSCLGTISGHSTDRELDLAVRLCLNTALSKHAGEVIELLRRYPGQDRPYYLLGLLLGGALERTCPQYPLIKERMLPHFEFEGRAVPST